MANFLITGSRAPVALELARNFAKFGHQVYLADSLQFPLARHSKFVTKSFYITAPRKSLKKFKVELEEILNENDIDMLIPTCEEVFYISSIKKKLEIYSEVFCPDYSVMELLHSKVDIFSCAIGSGFLEPNTEVMKLEELLLREGFKGKVVKKEYCRFGTDVLLEPSVSLLHKRFKRDNESRFILQDKIEGNEYCSYAISKNGKVSFVSIYEPMHRVRKAASIFFNPIYDPLIEEFIIRFCEINRITGQIGFDIIKNDMGIYLIECNPRATSGLHLLAESDLSKGFLFEQEHLLEHKQAMKPKMITLAMLLIGLPIAIVNSRLGEWKKDYRSAEDVISTEKDNFFLLYSLLSLIEISVISFKTLTSLRAASTSDIEWDGEVLNERK